jgi:uncharacterized membrane protein YeaQ/YmgE (transglycosylase-associated protein family)
MDSKKFSLNKGDLFKIGKGALIAAAGAVLAYLSAQVFPQLSESGNSTMIVVAAIGAVVVNAAQKYLRDNAGELEAPSSDGDG